MRSGGWRLAASVRTWTLIEPFVISREVIRTADTLHVRLEDEHGNVGRGEAHGVTYAGDTPARMLREVEAVVHRIEAGIDRRDLLALLPAGGARYAVDSALWDLETKQGLPDPFARCGVAPHPVQSAVTIAMRSIEAYEASARAARSAPWLKVKVGADEPIAALEAIRRGSPDARLIVDPNQAWSVPHLKVLMPDLVRLRVDLLEQPVPVGTERELIGYNPPIPLCADEALNDADDLPAIAGAFQAVNIKLDKVGGLTAAWDLADAAVALGLEVMVGTMLGPSLGVAAAMVLAQRCRYVDLDGPPLLTADDPFPLHFDQGLVRHPHDPALWG